MVTQRVCVDRRASWVVNDQHRWALGVSVIRPFLGGFQYEITGCSWRRIPPVLKEARVAKAMKRAAKAKKTSKTSKTSKAGNKTVATKSSVGDFVASIDDDARRNDAKAAAKLIADATGEKATMWGSAIIGFGAYHYKYDSGREGDTCKIGLSPRKSGLVLYNVVGDKSAAAKLKKLGKHKVSGGCLHIAKLADVDQTVLREMVMSAYASLTAKHG